jgi:hypothetical protein
MGQVARFGVPAAAGLLSAGALLGLFIGTLSLLGGLDYALEEFERLQWWLVALAAGFGVQVALYAHIKRAAREAKGGAEVAASGGISAGAMLACCSHYLTNILPIVGISAFSMFLTKYQTSFLVLGIFSNIVGMTYMLYFMQRHGLLPQWAGAGARCNMKTVRNAALAVGAVAVVASFFFPGP